MYCEVCDRLAHGLDEVGQRVEVPAHEADDEVVVADVEPVAGETDVVGEVGLAVGAPEHAVLADDGSLLLGREPRERPDPAQRIPDPPRPGRIQHGPSRPLEQPVLEVALEARTRRCGRAS